MNNIHKEINIDVLLKNKMVFAGQYLSTVKEMETALMQKEFNNINKFISKRVDYINKIKKIDISLQKAIRSGSDKFYEIFYNYIDRTNNLFEQIIPIDESIMLMIKAESRSIKEDLLKMNSVRHANKGYGKTGKQIPKYFDDRR